MIDEFKTIKDKSEGTYSELRSKFLAFAHHVPLMMQWPWWNNTRRNTMMHATFAGHI